MGDHWVQWECRGLLRSGTSCLPGTLTGEGGDGHPRRGQSEGGSLERSCRDLRSPVTAQEGLGSGTR